MELSTSGPLASLGLVQAVELIPHPAYIAGVQGQVAYVNRRWQHYTGLSFTASLGFAGGEAIHPDDRERVYAAYLQAVDSATPYECRYRLRRFDGVYGSFQGRAEPVRAENSEIIAWIGTATELVEASGTPPASQVPSLLERALREAPVGFALLDRDLRYQSINPALARLNGFPVEAHLGRTIEEMIPDLAPLARPRFQAVLEGTTPMLNLELSGESAQQPGVLRHWLEHVYAIGLPGEAAEGVAVLLVEDSERRWAEAALRERQALYLPVMESLDQGFCLCELLYTAEGVAYDYRFLEVNPAFERQSGLSGVVGKTALEMIPGLERHWVETYAQVVQTGMPFRFEQRAETLGRWFEVTAVRVGGPGSREVALLFSDVSERRQAEAALRSSEARLALGMQVSGLGLAEIDYASDTVQLSPQAAALYGLDDGELRVSRERLHATFHPDERSELEAVIAGVLDPEGPGWFERDHRIVLPSGETRWLSVRKQVFFDSEQTPPLPTRAILAALNVTGRLQDREQVQQAAWADRFRVQLADALRPLADPVQIQAVAARVLGEHLGLSRVQYAEVSPDGLWAEVFQDYVCGVRSLVGQLRLDSFGRSLMASLRDGQTLVLPDTESSGLLEPSVQAAYASIEVRATLTVPLIKEKRLVGVFACHQATPRHWSEAEVRLIEETAERTWAALERSRAEEARRESEARFRTVFEQAAVGVAQLRSHSGRFVRVNRRYAEIVGYSAEEMLELDFQNITHPDDLAEDLENMHRLLSGECREFKMEKRYLRKDGEVVWVRLSVSAMWAVGSPPEHHIAVVEDITERRQAELALQASEARARALVESQKRFVNDAAHELRAPLTAIQGNLELLHRYPHMDPSDRAEALADVAQESARLGRLVNDMLALARGDAGERLRLESLRLDTVLEGAFQSALPLASDHELRLEALPPLSVRGDADQLRQLGLILLENALRYTPAGGRVTLTLEREASEAVLRVIDSGIGIATEDLDRVFERFFRTDKARVRVGGGTGLGLAIARGIVEGHGGKIWLESELGQGTVAVVRLPLCPDPA